jgi:hypothetical protein
VRRTVPPSAEIEGRIDELLAGGWQAGDAQGALSELAHLGAKLIIQRAVEEEFDAFLGRERYERRADALPGKRNGWRPRRLQTAEGELKVEIPQLREAAEPFTSKLFPRESKRLLTTEPLKALVVGAFVRGLSMRDVEALCEGAGCRRRACRGSVRSSSTATAPSASAGSPGSSWWRSTSMPSICRSGRWAARRACSAPGASIEAASGF